MLEEIKLKPKSRTNYVDTQVGQNLKKYRLMYGLSQQALADAADVSVQQIQKYEKATNRISSSKLFVFSKLLNTAINDFFTGIEDENLEELDHNTEIAERELLSLIKAFNSINDQNIRKKIIELTKSLSIDQDLDSEIQIPEKEYAF
jgi:transcriptional regulator with XRE-family HTH domain